MQGHKEPSVTLVEDLLAIGSDVRSVPIENVDHLRTEKGAIVVGLLAELEFYAESYATVSVVGDELDGRKVKSAGIKWILADRISITVDPDAFEEQMMLTLESPRILKENKDVPKRSRNTLVSQPSGLFHAFSSDLGLLGSDDEDRVHRLHIALSEKHGTAANISGLVSYAGKSEITGHYSNVSAATIGDQQFRQ